jgi:hypothetical protein
MPQMIKNARPQAGDAVYARQGQNMFWCFRDHNRQKPVTLVSTFYSATNTLNGKPRIICAYNTFMCGVDLSDQMIVAYNDHRKCNKVWKKIIYHTFHRIMLNSYILYCGIGLFFLKVPVKYVRSHNSLLAKFNEEKKLSAKTWNPFRRSRESFIRFITTLGSQSYCFEIGQIGPMAENRLSRWWTDNAMAKRKRTHTMIYKR